jgi:spore coat protein U-like protein
MMRKLALAMLFLLACGARQAAAATCSISATSIVFGSYTGATTVNVTGTLNVNCPNGSAYYITLTAGQQGGSVTTRKMLGQNSVLLGYGLFSDSARTLNWGNTYGTNTVSGTGSGVSQIVTIYAQLPSSQYAPGGGENSRYSDTIQVAIVSPTGGFTTAAVNFNVNATGSASCAITASPLNFANYTGALLNSTTTISVTCTNGTSYNVGLNAGTATGATVTKRSMTGPASALLGYKLFSNSGYTINWGNTVGTDTVARKGTGTGQSITVYGQIPAGESARIGTYTDTITATITY